MEGGPCELEGDLVYLGLNKSRYIMKKMQLLALLLAGLSSSILVNAQQKVQETVVIKTPTVQCQECKERIEKYLSHEEGIQKVNVDYKKKTATVTYLTNRTNPENIKALIANTG